MKEHVNSTQGGRGNESQGVIMSPVFHKETHENIINMQFQTFDGATSTNTVEV